MDLRYATWGVVKNLTYFGSPPLRMCEPFKHLVALDDTIQMHQRSLAADKNLTVKQRVQGGFQRGAGRAARHASSLHVPRTRDVSLPPLHSGNARTLTAPPLTPEIAQVAHCRGRPYARGYGCRGAGRRSFKPRRAAGGHRPYPKHKADSAG